MTATSGKLMKGVTGDWEVVIGMEVHAQITSNSKLFSGAATAFAFQPPPASQAAFFWTAAGLPL